MYSHGVWSSPPTGPSPSSVGRPCDAVQEPSETPPAAVSPKTWPSCGAERDGGLGEPSDALRPLEGRWAAEVLVRELDALVVAEGDCLAPAPR